MPSISAFEEDPRASVHHSSFIHIWWRHTGSRLSFLFFEIMCGSTALSSSFCSRFKGLFKVLHEQDCENGGKAFDPHTCKRCKQLLSEWFLWNAQAELSAAFLSYHWLQIVALGRIQQSLVSSQFCMKAFDCREHEHHSYCCHKSHMLQDFPFWDLGATFQQFLLKLRDIPEYSWILSGSAFSCVSGMCCKSCALVNEVIRKQSLSVLLKKVKWQQELELCWFSHPKFTQNAAISSEFKPLSSTHTPSL